MVEKSQNEVYIEEEKRMIEEGFFPTISEDIGTLTYDPILTNEAMNVVGTIKTHERKNNIPEDLTQWGIVNSHCFMGSGITIPILSPGVYQPRYSDIGIVFDRKQIITDDILILPDSVNASIIDSIQKFWGREDRFREYGQTFKRGILLWGPPGGGKTATIALLIQDRIEMGGIVFLIDNPDIAIDAFTIFRGIEPLRNIICIYEDIDAIIKNHGEHRLLSLLDGENQMDHVVNIATTNYPEILPPRLLNRPSRFDEIIHIGMPTPEMRFFFLRAKISKEDMSDSEIENWVSQTNGFSLAYLKELIISVLCLDNSFEDTMVRLKNMQKASANSSKDTKPIGFTRTLT